jgi:hypothetical protein
MGGKADLMIEFQQEKVPPNTYKASDVKREK